MRPLVAHVASVGMRVVALFSFWLLFWDTVTKHGVARNLQASDLIVNLADGFVAVVEVNGLA